MLLFQAIIVILTLKLYLKIGQLLVITTRSLAVMTEAVILQSQQETCYNQCYGENINTTVLIINNATVQCPHVQWQNE